MDSSELREEVLPALPQDLPLEKAPVEESTPCKTAAVTGELSPQRSRLQVLGAPPCFFAGVCRKRAAVEKAGRSVCHQCAGTRLRGIEYPLRDAASEPLYLTGRAASEALDMVEDISQRARRGLRGGVWS